MLTAAIAAAKISFETFVMIPSPRVAELLKTALPGSWRG
jgi:hypothetical protein